MASVQRLRELIDINRAIVETLDYDELLGRVMDKVALFSGAEHCALLMCDADGLARIKAARGLDEARVRAFAAPLDERINRVLRELLDYGGDDSFIVVPVVEGGSVRGLLASRRSGPVETRGEDEYLLSALADQAAIALGHAARFERERRRGQRSARLLAVMQDASQTALAYLDCALCFQEVNRAYARLHGLEPEALIGRRYAEVTNDERRLALIADACALGEAGEIRELEIGAGVWDWFVCPVPEEGGAVISATEVTDRVLARRASEEAARRKDEFLGALSHELRNPLMPITTSVELLEVLPAASEQAGQARQILARQVGHLVRLVDDLLDVTRITRGKIQLARGPADLGVLVDEAVLDHRALFDERGVTLEQASEPGPLPLDADTTRLAQVIGNLLQNAAKFTPSGGRVRIGAAREDDEAVLRVSDTGIGIPTGALVQLFHPFAQVDAGLDRSRGGLGLGLALVRGLVELHQGRVEARSEGAGQGAEFIVRLPLAGGIQTARDAARASEPQASRRVLVIEDSRDGALSLAALLSASGHEVRTAHDGSEGLALARTWRPDVILCDIGLPGLDGYDVARAIRKDRDLSGSLLVSLSGYGQPEDVRNARAAGFDRHLTKPARMEALRELLGASPAPPA